MNKVPQLHFASVVGKSRGVGFCRMENKEVCEKIIHSLNKKMLPGSTEPLLIKFADSGNKKKREFRQNMMGYDNMGLVFNSIAN